MKTKTRNAERGVAIFFSIFALLLLTAIGAALIFNATTETSINSNFRQEEVAYFGAKAGIEEARARMMALDPSTINVTGDVNQPLLDPTLVGTPTTLNHMVYYIVNPGNGPAVQPWDAANAYVDDELCHEGYVGLALTVAPPDVRCTGTGVGLTNNNSYVVFNSTLPYSGTAGALPFKWARITPKLNGTVTDLQGTGGTVNTVTEFVNPLASVTVNGVPVAIGPTTLICWDGQEEVPLTITALPTPITKCSDMISQAGPFQGAPMTTAYLVTAMGVSSSSNNAARKMIQSEVALQPMPPFPYGMYATSTACPALTFTGNNPSTDSYTTAGGKTYANSHTPTGGDIGSNGGVNIGNGDIGGTIGVLQPPPVGNGNCVNPFVEGPNGTAASGSTPACPTGVAGSCYMPEPYKFPTPPAPNPPPPNTSYTALNCGAKKNGGECMVPGTYGNITVNGTLYLAPGTYNVNSLSMQGNGQIIVNPPGAVTLNVAGIGQTNPLTIAGNGITDDTIPNDFVINYAGTGTVSITGNGDVTAQLDAPNATIIQQGNGNWYGSIVGSQITVGGNAFFHYDKNAALAPNNNGYYLMVAYREVPY